MKIDIKKQTGMARPENKFKGLNVMSALINEQKLNNQNKNPLTGTTQTNYSENRKNWQKLRNKNHP